MKIQDGTPVLSVQMPFEHGEGLRSVQARASGLHLPTATETQEHGRVTLAIVGRFETVASKARITIRQARALWATRMFQTSCLPDDQRAWLKLQVYNARGL